MDLISPGRMAAGIASAAVAAAVAFTAWALSANVYSDAGTLLEQNTGWPVRAVVAAPLLGTVLVWSMLRAACSQGSRRCRIAATVTACALVALSALSILSIGAAMLPPAVLALLAALITPVDRAAPTTQ
jgi:hypothetical protein